MECDHGGQETGHGDDSSARRRPRTRQAADKLKKSDPHLFEISDLGAPTAADEWTALRDEESTYWAETGEHLTAGARTGADLISEDRGE